jgi:uncharacterized protein YjdB
MKRKFTLFFLLIAFLFVPVRAQILLDPATVDTTGWGPNKGVVELDGTKYCWWILDGWSTSISIPSVEILPGHTEFHVTVKYAEGTSGYTYDQVNTFLKLVDPGWTELCASGQGSSLEFKEYTVTGPGLTAGTIVGAFQFAGQETSGWSAIAGDTLFFGMLTMEDPNALIDPNVIDTATLKDGWWIEEIDGWKYFKVYLEGWGTSWDKLPQFTLPENISSYKTMTKYAEGSSGFTVDQVNTFIKIIDPGWGELSAIGAGSSTEFIKRNGALESGVTIGGLQLAGQETSGWSAVTGDTVWLGIFLPDWVDSIEIKTAGDVTTISEKGGNLGLSIVPYPGDVINDSVTWTVNDEGIGFMTDSGYLHAVMDGDVMVYATAKDGSGVMDSILINITGQVSWVETITVTSEGDATSIDTKGGTLQMYADPQPRDAEDTTFYWFLTPLGLAEIDANGLLTAMDDGVVEVWAIANDPGNAKGMMEITFTNQVRVESIDVIGEGSLTEIPVKGGTLQMVYTLTPEDASNQEVTWSVDDENIATIDPVTGILTAVANGDVVVTATSKDPDAVSGTCTVNVWNQGTNVEDVSGKALVLYPNPASKTLHIENAGSVTSLEIINMDGKVMMRVLNNRDRIDIDVSGLANGIYTVRTYLDNQTRTYKFVKE